MDHLQEVYGLQAKLDAMDDATPSTPSIRNTSEIPNGSLEDTKHDDATVWGIGALRPTACIKCRQRRAFCSKERPKCSRCQANSLECVYLEGRKISVSEQFVNTV